MSGGTLAATNHTNVHNSNSYNKTAKRKDVKSNTNPFRKNQSVNNIIYDKGAIMKSMARLKNISQFT